MTLRSHSSVYMQRKTCPQIYKHPSVHCSTVYNSRTWKQPKVLWTNEWIKKACMYTHMHARTYTLWNTASSKKKKK